MKIKLRDMTKEQYEKWKPNIYIYWVNGISFENEKNTHSRS